LIPITKSRAKASVESNGCHLREPDLATMDFFAASIASDLID
jgi:hypothetical protein